MDTLEQELVEQIRALMERDEALAYQCVHNFAAIMRNQSFALDKRAEGKIKKYGKGDLVGGDVVYLSLPVGNPEELYGGHWCYVLEVLPRKILVVPLTSYKGDDVHPYDRLVLLSGEDHSAGMCIVRFEEIRTFDRSAVVWKKGTRRLCDANLGTMRTWTNQYYQRYNRY